MHREAEESVSKFTSPHHLFHRAYQGGKQVQEDLPQETQAAQDLAQFRWDPSSSLESNDTHIVSEFIFYASFYEPMCLS